MMMKEHLVPKLQQTRGQASSSSTRQKLRVHFAL